MGFLPQDLDHLNHLSLLIKYQLRLLRFAWSLPAQWARMKAWPVIPPVWSCGRPHADHLSHLSVLIICQLLLPSLACSLPTRRASMYSRPVILLA